MAVNPSDPYPAGMNTPFEFDVVDHAAASRYEARLADGTVLGYLEYRLDGDTTVMPSTVVDPQHRGRGIAARLARSALDDARAARRKVEPSCWYVAEYIENHPEYANLVR